MASKYSSSFIVHEKTLVVRVGGADDELPQNRRLEAEVHHLNSKSIYKIMLCNALLNSG
jgi:hypothetical protein